MESVHRVIAPGRRRGAVTVPSSKSIAHRELIAAALSGAEPPVIRGESKDTLATRACLKAMMSGESAWPCGESGTTLRLLEPIAGVMGWKGEFVCEGRLGERPRMPFERKSRYVVPGNVSSQFVSGLLMALPLADWDSEIAVEGTLQSEAYVRLTEDTLRESDIAIRREGNSWFVSGGQRYKQGVDVDGKPQGVLGELVFSRYGPVAEGACIVVRHGSLVLGVVFVYQSNLFYRIL